MSKNLVIKLLLIVSMVAFFGFLVQKPYNQLCRAVNWCQPISFSYLLPSFKGEKSISIEFLADSEVDKVSFELIDVKSALLSSGEKFAVKYRVKNNSADDIRVRPIRFFENGKLAQYLKFYECLCFESYKVKSGSDLDLVLRFRVLPKIDDIDELKNIEKMAIGYSLNEE